MYSLERKLISMNKNTIGMTLALTSTAIFVTYFGVMNIEVFKSIAISLTGLFLIVVSLLLLSHFVYFIYNKITNEPIGNEVNKDKVGGKSGSEIVSEATITIAEIFLNNKKDKPCK